MTRVDLADLIPHRESARLLDRVEHWDETHIVCSVTIGSDHPYLLDGKVPAIVGMELMAQAVAAYVGMRRRASGAPPRIGYLVGARRLDLHVDGFRPADLLSVTATPTWLDGRAGSFECRVDGEGVRLCDATLSVYEASSEEMPP